MKTKVMLAVGLFAWLAVMSGYGQQASINAKIDFPFTVEGKVLPAGQYAFVPDNSAFVIRVTGEGKNSLLVPIITRLSGETHSTKEDAHIVFDKVGDKYLLSEVWIPGEDGYVLLATKGPHGHQIVNVRS